MLVDLHSPLAWSRGTENMVILTGHYGGDVVFSGHGAGGHPTAVAVVSDLLALAHGSRRVEIPSAPARVSAEFEVPHYIRFLVNDRPGIVAEITGALAKERINIRAIVQKPAIPRTRCPSWSPWSRASPRRCSARWPASRPWIACWKSRWICRCWSSKELLRLRSPGLQPVLVQQHFLPIDPLLPGRLRDVLVDLLAKLRVKWGLFKALQLLLIANAKNHMRHRVRSFRHCIENQPGAVAGNARRRANCRIYRDFA
jgi:hypothetical protein